jgi:hypothetical protein
VMGRAKRVGVLRKVVNAWRREGEAVEGGRGLVEGERERGWTG